MRIEIDVQDGSGDPMTHLVLEPEVVLGSGADATIRVRSERLAPRHLLLVPRGRRGCWVSSNPRALDPTIVGSQTLGNGLVPWGTELRIGETCVRLRRTFGHAPIVAIGALLAVFALVAVVLEAQKDSGSAPLTGRPSPPSRSLALESSSVCPGPGEALAVAQRQEREALLRHERIPYAPDQALLALRGFRTASNCYRSANESAEAARLEATASELVATIETTVATTRLRLRDALAANHWADVTKQARLLLALTPDQGEDDYVEWLRYLVRNAPSRQKTHR